MPLMRLRLPLLQLLPARICVCTCRRHVSGLLARAYMYVHALVRISMCTDA